MSNERQRSAFGPGGSITASSSLDGVNTDSVARFSIPKVNGFDTALMPSWEAAELRLFRCSSFAEQGTVSTLSFMLVIGSEVGFGRRASAAAPLRCGLAGGKGDAMRLMHIERITARNRTRRNLAVLERQRSTFRFSAVRTILLEEDLHGCNACD